MIYARFVFDLPRVAVLLVLVGTYDHEIEHPGIPDGRHEGIVLNAPFIVPDDTLAECGFAFFSHTVYHPLSTGVRINSNDFAYPSIRAA